MSYRPLLAACFAALLALASSPVRAEQARIKAVASFSILADLVHQVGGDRVDVSALVGPDGDVHVFNPSPADASRITAASLVVVNGLGLEGWMDRLVGASGTKAPLVIASRGITPIEEEGHGHHHDPHAWQSVANAKIYVANIRDGLIAADPPGREAYTGNATRYLGELDRLDGEVRAAVARIPAPRRRIITTHDAFGYFASTYGLAFIAPQGVSTDAEASAKDVARIIRQIKAQTIPAVFIENVPDPRLMDRIAKEAGARIGRKLYSDALSAAGGPAASYLDMMRHNIKAFEAALAE